MEGADPAACAISDFWIDGASALLTRAKLLRTAGREFQSEVTEGLRLLKKIPADPMGRTLREEGWVLLAEVREKAGGAEAALAVLDSASLRSG